MMATTNIGCQRAFIVGVGMTKFEKPKSKHWDYPDMARQAGEVNFTFLFIRN